jgi:hypothetical protein
MNEDAELRVCEPIRVGPGRELLPGGTFLFEPIARGTPLGKAQVSFAEKGQKQEEDRFFQRNGLRVIVLGRFSVNLERFGVNASRVPRLGLDLA